MKQATTTKTTHENDDMNHTEYIWWSPCVYPLELKIYLRMVVYVKRNNKTHNTKIMISGRYIDTIFPLYLSVSFEPKWFPRTILSRHKIKHTLLLRASLFTTERDYKNRNNSEKYQAKRQQQRDTTTIAASQRTSRTILYRFIEKTDFRVEHFLICVPGLYWSMNQIVNS